MKLLFKNNTKYTKEHYNAFIEFHRKKYGKKIILRGLLLTICGLYIILFNLFRWNWKTLLLLLGIAFILLVMNKIRMKQQVRDNKKVVGSQKQFTFYFYEKYIKIKCGRKFDRLRYFEIHRAFETREYFFLYTDEEHSLIISKEGFEVGTAKEFTMFIKKKCLLKYKEEKEK